MICRACDSPDVSFVTTRRPHGSPQTFYLYRCNTCRFRAYGPEPVWVDFTEEQS